MAMLNFEFCQTRSLSANEPVLLLPIFDVKWGDALTCCASNEAMQMALVEYNNDDEFEKLCRTV